MEAQRQRPAVGLQAVGLGSTSVGAQGVELGVADAPLISCLVEGSCGVAVAYEL